MAHNQLDVARAALTARSVGRWDEPKTMFLADVGGYVGLLNHVRIASRDARRGTKLLEGDCRRRGGGVGRRSNIKVGEES